MAAAVVISLKRGDTLSLIFSITNDTTGILLPLSGATARFALRPKAGGEPLFTATSEDDNSGLVVEPIEYAPAIPPADPVLIDTTGLVALRVDYDVTETWPLGLYAFDLELTFPDLYRISSATTFLRLVEDITL
jgi:hypothetical protein